VVNKVLREVNRPLHNRKCGPAKGYLCLANLHTPGSGKGHTLCHTDTLFKDRLQLVLQASWAPMQYRPAIYLGFGDRPHLQPGIGRTYSLEKPGKVYAMALTLPTPGAPRHARVENRPRPLSCTHLSAVTGCSIYPRYSQRLQVTSSVHTPEGLEQVTASPMQTLGPR
jgi:hypothetical protein